MNDCALQRKKINFYKKTSDSTSILPKVNQTTLSSLIWSFCLINFGKIYKEAQHRALYRAALQN
jgi:hypothetical protein